MEVYSKLEYKAKMREEQRRRQFLRRVRLKKIGAISVLVLMCLCVIAVVGGVIFGIYKFIDSRKMVEEPYSDARQQNIVLVQNVFGEADNFDDNSDLSADYASAMAEANEALSEELLTQTIDDSGDYPGNAGDTAADGQKYYAPQKGTVVSKDQLIVVDAGHGGMDCGAIGIDGVYEKTINLSIALLARDRLVEKGYHVYMSRADDTFIGLHERANKANDLGADAFVSVHLNSYPDLESVCGVEAWTYKDRTGCPEFADYLARYVSEAVGARNRGVSFAKNLVVTSKTEMPSVIIECGYISNADEAAKLQTEDYQKKIAQAIADAVEAFLERDE